MSFAKSPVKTQAMVKLYLQSITKCKLGNLQAKMTVQGVQFNPLEVAYLNQLPSSVTDRIDKLWDAFGSRIRNGLDALIAQELGKVLTSSELLILNNIGDNQFLYANMAKIIILQMDFLQMSLHS